MINISITLYNNTEIRKALEAAFNAGIPIAAAAGNYNALASGFFPCSYHESVLCVGGVDYLYNMFDMCGDAEIEKKWGKGKGCLIGSNYGSGVSLLAPGKMIASTWSKSKDLNRYMAGTSMASPQ